MTIIEELIQSIQGDAPVREVIVSTHSTLVCSRGCGLTATQLSTKPHGEEVIRDAGSLHLKSGKDLAGYALSDNPLEASIGLAAINSLLEFDRKALQPLDAGEMAVKLSIGKKVTIVGHFPFNSRIKEAAEKCWVLELNPSEGEYSNDHAGEFIPQSDLVLLTAATLITHSIEDYLAFYRPQALVMLSGPSTPLSPLLFEHHIDILSGVMVEDEKKVIQAVSQGANLRQMQGIKKITLAKNPGHLLT
jgi:uncharacterized protein (DUF4213/DUF364 family)